MARKIVVFGSYITDLTAKTESFPSPGQTVLGTDFVYGPGGKGSNQAVAAHRAGSDVQFITKIGDDMFGEIALNFYENEKMSVQGFYIDKKYMTGTALIMVENHTGQNEIVIIPGACGQFNSSDIDKARELILEDCILLVQLETNLNATFEIMTEAKKKKCTVIMNPAPAKELDHEILQLIDVITPNESEVFKLTGVNVDDGDLKSLRRAANIFFNNGVKKILITLGDKGSYANDGEYDKIIPPIKLDDVVDTTGAGDAYNGGFAAALACGLSFFESAQYASVVGGLSVTKSGTAPAMPFKKEINDVYCSIAKKD